MLCLSCGFCCKTISPINGSYCPLLVNSKFNSEEIFYCSDYKNRPIECKNHSFCTSVCAIGLSELKLDSDALISIRVENIHKLLIQEFGRGLF